MNWLVTKLVTVGVDLIVKMVLKYIEEHDKPTEPTKKPLRVVGPKKPEPEMSGWGDK